MTDSAYYVGITMHDLMANRHMIPEQTWTAEGLLPPGLVIMAAREKVGKSLLTLGSIASAVALGTSALQRFTTTKGSVAVFSLEESLQVIIERATAFFSHADAAWHPPENLRLYLGDSITTWSENAVDQIEEHVCSLPDLRLIVVDTLRMALPAQKTSGAAGEYVAEYQQATRLHQLGLRYNATVLCLHHTTKSTYQDPFDSIAGTSLTKAAEALLLLEREGKGLKLQVRGRSIPTTSYSLSMDPETLLWTATDDDPTNAARSRQRESALAQITIEQIFESDEPMRHADVKRRMKTLGFSASSADRWLEDKVSEGALSKLDGKRGYQVPVPELGGSDETLRDKDQAHLELFEHEQTIDPTQESATPDDAVEPPPPPSECPGVVADGGTTRDPAPDADADQLTTRKVTVWRCAYEIPRPPRDTDHRYLLDEVKSPTGSLNYSDLVKYCRAKGYRTINAGRWLDAAVRSGYVTKAMNGDGYLRTIKVSVRSYNHHQAHPMHMNGGGGTDTIQRSEEDT